MIIQALLLAVAISPPRGMSLLTLDRGNKELNLYRITSGKSRETLKLVPVKRLVLEAPLETVVQKRLTVSADGKYVAFVLKHPYTLEIRALRTSNLKTIFSRKVRDAYGLMWSPKGDGLAYSTLSRSIGLLGVRSGIPDRPPMPYDNLMWSRDGKLLYLSKDPKDGQSSQSNPEAQWDEIPISGWPGKTVSTSQAIQETWFANSRLGPIRSFSPRDIWSTQGHFVSFGGGYRNVAPVRDVFFREGSPIEIVRGECKGSYMASQFIKSQNEIIYAQEDVLFDNRESPELSLWIGRLLFREKSRRQWSVRLPNPNLGDIGLVPSGD